jgi:hypothetical protein
MSGASASNRWLFHPRIAENVAPLSRAAVARVSGPALFLDPAFQCLVLEIRIDKKLSS